MSKLSLSTNYDQSSKNPTEFELDNKKNIVFVESELKTDPWAVIDTLVNNNVLENTLTQHSNIAFVNQAFSLFKAKTVKENITLTGVINNRFNQNNFEILINDLALDKELNKQSTKVSKYVQLKTCIARAILQEPKIIIFNHISENLANSYKQELVDILNKIEAQFDIYFVYLSKDLFFIKNIAKQIGVNEQENLIYEDLRTAFVKPQSKTLKKLIQKKTIQTLPEQIRNNLKPEQSSSLQQKTLVKICFSVATPQEVLLAYAVQELNYKINIIQAYVENLPLKSKTGVLVCELENKLNNIDKLNTFLNENNSNLEILGYVN